MFFIRIRTIQPFLSSIACVVLLLTACGGGSDQATTTETLGNSTNTDSTFERQLAQTETLSDPANADTAADKTFPVKSTAGISTGMVKLAHTETLTLPLSPTIDWGDGSEEVPALLDCIGISTLISCNYWNVHIYEHPGTYPITVTYDFFIKMTTTAVVAPIGNFIIVSIGDSVASGEGNPVVPARRAEVGEPIPSHPAYWDRDACHISSKAGPALAAREIQSTNPGTAVTFIHLACSGANIGSIAQQLSTARELLQPYNNIDALLISAGANDVDGGFGHVVSTCIGPYPPDGLPDPSIDCSTDTEFSNRLAMDIAGLDYSKITTSIDDNNLNVTDTYITEYFDPTHDASGQFPGPVANETCTGGLMKYEEWEFLYNHMVVPLNAKVITTEDEYGWHYIGDLASDFLHHGYCADPTPGNPTGLSWVVKLPETLHDQWDTKGTAHPNGDGQSHYQKRIVDAINLWTPPITTASATSAGVPYEFGTWTNKDVEVTLSARNKLATAGTGDTYFAVDEPACGEAGRENCLLYSSPFSITESGAHTISFLSANRSGKFEKVKTAEVWIDKDPPVMTCSAVPPSLWPPNGWMVPVTLTVTAIDAVFGPSPFILKSVSTSEGSAASDIEGFVIGQPDTEGWLLVSRLGGGSGRIYTLTYESSDELGNTGYCTVQIPVPHDQRPSNR